MSAVKERLYKLLEKVPEDVLEELVEDIEDILALIEAKKTDDGARTPWEEARKELGLEDS
jgi:dihydroneopterin aldolase